MDLDVVWTQGKCIGDAHFVTNKKICYRTGSFLKFCATDKFSEFSIQGPLEGIECICACPESGLISVASRSIYVLSYPQFEIVTTLKTERLPYDMVMQMCFAGDNYLMTLEGSPLFSLTLWDWKKAIKVQVIQHKFPIEDVSECFMSIYPSLTKIFVFQQLSSLYFYEIEDIGSTVKLRGKTLYLPIIGDESGKSILNEESIEKLSYFDKMQHDAWGIHSELLQNLPLKIFCSSLSEKEFIGFHDFLMKQERLQASCHCWLPNRQLLVACSNGAVLLVKLDFTVQIIHSGTKSNDESKFDNRITCMAVNKSGVYVAEKNGNVRYIQDIEKWTATTLISVEDYPKCMKFSPDFKDMLVVNKSGSVVLLDVLDLHRSAYLSTCTDDSRIVGMSIVSSCYCVSARDSLLIETWDENSSYCVTARASGLIETWEDTGIKLSQLHIHETIVTMDGSPSSSVILVSGSSSHFFVIDVSAIRDPRIVQVSRPCEQVIQIIKSDNFGRFAFLVSDDQHLFVYSTVPSRTFNVLGYIETRYVIKALSVFSKGYEDAISVSLLGRGESEDHVIHMEIPRDFNVNFCQYYEDGSGLIKAAAVKFIDIGLGTRCCSMVSHLLRGLILYLPSTNELINIPYENIRAFKPNLKKSTEVVDSCQKWHMFLSPSHYLLLAVSESGNVCVRKAHDFSIVYNKKFSSHSRFLPHCAFVKNMIFLEACEGVLACLKLPTVRDMDEMSWGSQCRKNKKEENRFLRQMQSVSKTELLPWTNEQINVLYEENMMKLKDKRSELEEKFRNIKRELLILANANFSLPIDHQIESQEFFLDELVKEQYMKLRSEEISSSESTYRTRLENIENDISAIKEECENKMQEKGKILAPFQHRTTLYNYSIPLMSEKEKAEIIYSIRKEQLERSLLKLKSKENTESEDLWKEPSFDKSLEDETIEDIGKDLRRQPFQLQSLEDRMDYVFILKYIIFRKRLAFNRKFDELENLRKGSLEKIRENIQRIKEIKSLLREEEEEAIWEPSSLDNDSRFQITDAEIGSSVTEHLEEKELKGIADYFLKDEWLLKLKSKRTQKAQAIPKKANVHLLNKELEKRYKAVEELVDSYDDVHNRLAEDKLRLDLQINQEELELFLILFSLANFKIYKKGELYTKQAIEEMEKEHRENQSLIRDLQNSTSKSEKEMEKLMTECLALNKEVLKLSKLSRNKQAFLEAYDKRPITPEDTKSLNPFIEMRTHQENPIQELNTIKNKPQKVPLPIWKQLCTLREQKIALEDEIDSKMSKSNYVKEWIEKLNKLQHSLEDKITEGKNSHRKLHEVRIRCGYETPMVISVSDPQLQCKYPDDLDFREALFLRRFHVEGLNAMVTNVGNCKLKAVEQIAKQEYQVKKNEAKVRIDKLKLRDMKKEIELVKGIPMTKDIQKIIQDPKGFSLQDKIDALEKSNQMEMNEIKKQMNQVAERISSIELKKDILKRSTDEKRREIEKIKGDIAELQRIERLKK